MDKATRFNGSAFGRWINSRTGRIFRLAAGTGFFLLGIFSWGTPTGVAALIWSLFPLSAGVFDVCWVSAALGGPLRGTGCRPQVPSAVP